MQVILSTHSDSFVDVEHFDSIGRVFKVPDQEEPGRTHSCVHLVAREDLVGFCTSTGVPEDRVTFDSVAEYYSSTSNPKLNEGFFARCVVLVEGETEELALPVYLEAGGLDCDAFGVSVLKVVGKNQLPKYWRLFACFHVPTIVVCDGDGDSGSNANLAACFGLHADDFDVPAGEWVVKQSTTGPKTSILVFGPDFETAVRSAVDHSLGDGGECIDGYESDARQLIQPIGQGAKQQIARYVARHLVEELHLWPDFADTLAGLIRLEVDRNSSHDEQWPPSDIQDDPFCDDVPF